MVQVRVAAVAKDAADQHVLLLAPVDPALGPRRALPVWIGSQEAASILAAVQGATPPRPLAHDLMVRMLVSLDAVVDRVEVTRLDGGTFYAEVTLTDRRGTYVIDARPSDAVALAARAGAALWVADDVFAEAAVDDVLPEDDAEDESDEERIDEFRRFLDEVDPEDFQG